MRSVRGTVGKTRPSHVGGPVPRGKHDAAADQRLELVEEGSKRWRSGQPTRLETPQECGYPDLSRIPQDHLRRGVRHGGDQARKRLDGPGMVTRYLELLHQPEIVPQLPNNPINGRNPRPVRGASKAHGGLNGSALRGGERYMVRQKGRNGP